jgi:hypothetical protein
MKKLRLLAFACFLVSIAGLSTVRSQASERLACGEEWCNDDIACPGECGCTCDGTNPFPINCNGWEFGWCAVPPDAAGE